MLTRSERPKARWNRPRTVLLACTIPVAALTLAACGAASSSVATTPVANTSPGSGSTGGGFGRNFPGTTGMIAAVNGSTLEVQSTTAQTSVSFTSATRFTESVPGHVATGDCVVVSGTPVAGSDSALTATTVRVSAPVNGQCAVRGAGGFGGGRPRPSGTPSPGTSGGGFAARNTATGTVQSVSANGFVLNGFLRQLGGPGAAANGTASPSASPAASLITVTTDASTAVTTTARTTSAAAKVGLCATAIGSTDTTGAVAARSISLSNPTANGCTAGFGRFGGGGSGGQGGGISG